MVEKTNGITTTVVERSEGRAKIEKAAAESLLRKKISLEDYRELVKPNLTVADLTADLSIANKVILSALKKGDRVESKRAMALLDAVYQNVGVDLPPEDQGRVKKTVEKGLSALRASVNR